MLRSTLSVKISIAQLVETLNDDECIDVIRLLQHEDGDITLNTIVNRMIIQSTERLSNESLIKIENTIKDKYSQHSKRNTVSSTTKNNAITTHSVLFPLHRLPNDLLSKTPLFLNETDIFQFEQCCRMFYKMINNTSYLSQCNVFKHFVMTKKRLDQMKQQQYSFFKYSKANQLISNLLTDCYVSTNYCLGYDPAELLVDCMNDFNTTMNEMKKMGSYDNWWTSLFKSISILDIGSSTNVGPLLSQLPIDILFNPHSNESHLRTIQLSHFATRSRAWNEYMNDFEDQYLQCQKKWQQQGSLKIKSLQCVKHRRYNNSRYRSQDKTINPRYIDAKHVWMVDMIVELTDDSFLTNECNPGMKILTIENGINFILDISPTCKSVDNINRGLEIETMRLLSFHRHKHCYDICSKTVVIESLNLHNSLKNLTIECKIDAVKICDHQQKALENILQKTHYYNLTNVNIILELKRNIRIDWFFKLLKDNQKILQQQFQQLNIAIVKNLYNYRQKLHYVLEWDYKIDDKRLNQAKKQFDEIKVDDQNQDQFQEKYLLMREQWLN